MSISNVPSVAFTEAGLSLPLESQILAGVFADFNEAFGGNLNPALETPQGQLISSLTAIIGDKNAQIAEVINKIDPDTASGVFQDAIARIYFINRRPATATVVDVVCQGVPNTLIPVGVVVEDSDGNRYQNLSQGMIASDGNATITFTAINTGAIICPAQSIVTIYKGTVGLENVSNPTAGVTGSDTESRIQFEQRRRQSVAVNAHGSVDAIRGSVASVAGVTDVLVAENYTGQTVNVGATNYPMKPHSVLVSVAGGSDNEIARAIWQKKNVGCDMNGNVTVSVADTTYSNPAPTYAVTFLRPKSTPIKIVVQIAKSGVFTNQSQTVIKQALLNDFYGSQNSRVKMGDTFFASRFYGVINNISPLIQIVNITIGKGNVATAMSINIGVDEMPVLTLDDISIAMV